MILLRDSMNYDSHFPIYEVQNIQEFYNKNRKEQSDLDVDCDTEFDNISKIISIEANTGLEVSRKYLMRFDMDDDLYNAFDTTEKPYHRLHFRKKQSNYKYFLK